ncbi:MAG: phosphotransferase family protein [Angustibacter sp.]
MRLADRRSFAGPIHPASTACLAALYQALAVSDDVEVDATGQAVVFVADPADRVGTAATADRVEGALRHFGITVRVVDTRPRDEWSQASPARARVSTGAVPPRADSSAMTPSAVAPGMYLLGGSLHGWFVASGSVTCQADAVVDLVRRSRLAGWAAMVSPTPELELLHTPGSDSTGVVQFRGDGTGPLVAKVGPRDVIEAEVDFTGTVNQQLAGTGAAAPFPRTRAVAVEGHQAVNIMDAAEPMPVERLFADADRTRLADDAVSQLEPHLAALEGWYQNTADPGRPPVVADYLYRERFTALPEHPAFVRTFAARFPEVTRDEVLAVPVRLPGGLLVPGYREACRWLDGATDRLLPRGGSRVHGDLYLTNMLHHRDGRPVFIDPRTVWDGHPLPDPGYGDPVFDLATLLHGVLPMAAVLHAVATGRSETLLNLAEVALGSDELDLSSLRLPIEPDAAIRALERRLLRIPPLPEPEPVVRARLSIGAASSLAGWLKYDRSLSTAEAWLATYASCVWYLARARDLYTDWDQETST